MTESLVHLFVYGTLMRAADGWRFGKSQRDRLARESTFVGTAMLAARLYDLGNYPGLLLSHDPADVVHGEIVALADPDHSFRWLDPYESIVPGRPADSEYRREKVTARLAEGTTIAAWTYVYNHDLSAATAVHGGRWLMRG
jgi:gamma-glutamylcyclotransferase (GGCT)/AIG2-like uncharacterized protein YtfP